MSGMDIEGINEGVVGSGREANGIASSEGRPVGPPDPEVEPKASRRRFSPSYKLAILEEIQNSPGQGGAIMRREGLYSASVASWRKQRRQGTLVALSTKRGKKGKSPEEIEFAKLQRQNARLTRELEKAELIIGAQKKLAELLGVDLPKIAEKSDEKD